MFKIKSKTNSKILTLSPKIVENETTKKYIDKLKLLLKLDDCKNIAIVGTYGSGKSSIIKTFFHKNWKNKFRSLTITIGSYIIDDSIADGGEESSLSDNKISFKEQILVNRVEEAILKQLIFRKKFNKFPKSSLIRYDKEPWYKKFCYSAILLYSICFCIYYYYKFFKNQNLDIKNIYNFFGINIIIMSVIIILIVLKFIKILINKIRINKIKIKDCEIELYHDSNSLFSKYLTEIIYYFQITKCKLVIFEDLDRFPSDIALKVIQELKELNTILNDSYGIKKIVFIYAVKDSLFKKVEDKNKFYDYNLSILPISTTFNSELNLIGLLKDQNIYKELSSKVVSIVSKYIFDMRTLINIINDYCLFKELTNTKNYDKLFAMVAFKNYYYLEYNKLFENSDEDIINKTLETSTNKKLEILKELDEKIGKIQIDIDRTKNDVLINERELKELLLAKNTYNDNSHYIKYYRLGSSDSENISDFFKDEFDISLLENNEFTLRTNNGTEISENIVFHYFESKEKFLKRYKGLNKNDEILSLQNKINDINAEKEKIKYMNANEIFCKYYDKSLLDTTEDSSLLNELISFNFITSDYMDYVTSPVIYENSNNSESLMYSDSQFLMNVRQKKYSFDIKLTGFETIISVIKDSFDTPYVLNFDLLNYVIEHNNEYFSKILNQFKEPTKANIDFLISFIKKYPDKNDYIFEKLINDKCDIWSFISKNNNLFSIYDKQILFITMLNYNEYIKCVGEKITFKNFFENELGLNNNEFNDLLHNQNVRKSLLIIRPRIKNISILDEDNYNFIYKNNLYSFDIVNIHRILGTDNINFNLLKLNDESQILYDYINNDIVTFCNEYYIKHDCIIDERKTIMNIIYNSQIDLKTKAILYKREKFKLKNFDDIENELYELLVINNHLYIKWENIINLYKKIDDNLLFEYTTKFITNLNNKFPIKNIDIQKINKFFKFYILYLIKRDLKNTENILKFVVPIYEQINNMNCEELIILIKYKCLAYNKNNYKYICKKLSLVQRKDYVYNYFKNNINLTELVNTISVDDLEILLKSEKINNDEKLNLIYALYKKEKRKDKEKSVDKFIKRLKISYKHNRNCEITYNQTIYNAILRNLKSKKVFVKIEIINNTIKFKI